MEKIYEDDNIGVQVIDNRTYFTNKKDSTVLLSATYFQDGDADGHLNGTTDAAVLAIVAHHTENKDAIEKINEAIAILTE